MPHEADQPRKTSSEPSTQGGSFERRGSSVTAAKAPRPVSASRSASQGAGSTTAPAFAVTVSRRAAPYRRARLLHHRVPVGLVGGLELVAAEPGLAGAVAGLAGRVVLAHLVIDAGQVVIDRRVLHPPRGRLQGV